MNFFLILTKKRTISTDNFEDIFVDKGDFIGELKSLECFCVSQKSKFRAFHRYNRGIRRRSIFISYYNIRILNSLYYPDNHCVAVCDLFRNQSDIRHDLHHTLMLLPTLHSIVRAPVPSVSVLHFHYYRYQMNVKNQKCRSHCSWGHFYQHQSET